MLRARKILDGRTGHVTYTPAIRLTHEDHATLVRLERFQREHSGVEVHSGLGYWQAIIPEDTGSTIVTRYTLTVLLDRLDEVLAVPIAQ
jgi:hypothetical protein